MICRPFTVRSSDRSRPGSRWAAWRSSIAPTSAPPRICPLAASTGEGYWYARVGYGGLFAESTHHAGAFGFGHRVAFNRLALDISFLNGQLTNSGLYYGSTSSAWTPIKLEGLYYTHPNGSRSAFFGGGLSYGRVQHSAVERWRFSGEWPRRRPARVSCSRPGTRLDV